MNNKYKFISILFILFFLSMSLVSANDFDNQTMNLRIDEITDIGASTQYPSFKDLQQTINDVEEGGTLILNDSYINDESNPYSITIKKSLTLDGNGATLDGNKLGTILFINADNVTLKNLIFKNGQAANSGAISWSGNGGTIDGCTFENNIATQYISGAINWIGDDGTITNSKFISNSAPSSGGAVRITGNNYLIDNNYFEKNSAYNIGGGMIILGNFHTITNNNFISNFANSSGGGFRIEGNNSIITNNFFDRNVANVNLGGGMICLGNNTYIANNIYTNNIAGRDGGALDIEGYVISEDYSIPGLNNTIRNNTFINNSATYGGGISMYCSDVHIIENHFNDNYASELGGALRMAGGTTINGEILDNTFNNNTADVSGGAIFASFNKATISGNTFTKHVSTNKNEQSGGSGGTITIHGFDTLITDNEFTDSIATRSGGAIYTEGRNSTVSHNKFKNTNAKVTGGAIYAEGEYVTITNNEFDTTEITEGNGGAIRLIGNNADISNNTIKNSKSAVSGGSLYIDGNSTIITNNNIDESIANGESGGVMTINGNDNKISENTFTNSKSNRIGGAIYATGDNTEIAKNTFKNNEALTGNGGAIYISGESASIDDNEFENIKANQFGGAIFISAPNSSIINNVLTEITAGASGGAIYASGDNLKIEKNEITNTNASNVGGAISATGDKVRINNNIISKNTATKNGGAIYLKGNEAAISNNTFEENTAGTAGGAIQIEGDSSTISDNQFTNNFANTYGGAISTNGANIEITNNIFNKNTAATSGGAINGAGKTTIKNNKFVKNAATSNTGGAINLNGDQSIISDNDFEENSAKTGGAVTLTSKESQITNNVFDKNNATDTHGGALRLNSGDGSTINGNTFEGNTASGFGAAAYVQGNDVTASNNIFANNAAGSGTNGGALRWAGDNAKITENTFRGNTANSGTAIYGSGANTKITENKMVNSKEGDNSIRWTGDNQNITNNIYTESDPTTKLKISDVTMNYGGSSKLTATLVDSDSKGLSGKEILIDLNGQTIKEKTDSNGQVNIDLKDFNAGTYTATAKFAGDGDYDASSASANVKINKAPTELVLKDIKDIILGQELAITATVNATGGSVTFDINGNKTTLPLLSTGKAIYVFKPTLGDHTYNVIATYNPSDNYLTSSASATFEVTRKPTTLSGENVTVYNGGEGQLIFTLTDETTSKGMPLIEVNIDFNGQSYTQKTDREGKITIDLENLAIGTYDGFVSYAGDKIFAPSNATATAIVKSTIESEDLTADYNNVKYSATFLDSEGKPLAKGEYVTFMVDNDSYRTQVQDNGIATATIDKNAGSYTITSVNTQTGERKENKLTINKVATKTTLTGVEDIEAGNPITITAEVNATEGSVTFKVNKDESIVNLTDGKAALTLTGLGEGTYTVTATYKDANNNYLTSQDTKSFKVTKKITTLTANNVDIYFSNEADIIITLKDKKSTLAKKDITVTINGKKETCTTNEKGTVTISVSGKEVATSDVSILFAGNDEYEPSNTTATITVKSTIESQDVTADYGKATYSAKFLDKTGKALAKDTEVTFTIGNDEIKAKTDANGIATTNINKDHGKYTITNKNPATNETTKNNIEIKQVATKTELTGVKDIYTGDKLTVTASVNTTVGTVTFKVNKDETTKNLTKGKATLDLSDLDEGTYTVTATYKDTNNNYLTSQDTKTFKVTKKDVKLDVKTIDIEEGENAVFDVTATPQSGEVTLSIDNKKYTQNLTNGKTTFTVSNLTAGNFKYTVTYDGDKYYYGNSTEGTINVKSTKIIIDAPDIEKYYGDSKRFVVTVTDKDKNPLKGISLTIILNGVEYDRTTGDAGSTSVGINLPANNYTAEIIFKGNENYSALNTTSNINIKTTIIGFDVVKIEKSPEPYVATFLDSTGKYVSQGEYMRFNINGVFYDRVIRENGQAKLNLNLEANTYIITAYNTITGEESSNTITIKPRIVNNSDVTKFYRNGTQYYVTLLDDNGNPVKANETVTFNINGVFYERKTNENGTAKLNINLEPKTYIITAEYKNCRVSNTIKVLPVLSAKDLTMKYKDGSQFKANLVDGQGKAYANQTITFNVNGVFYYRQTDINGTAKLNINLMAGKYIITSSYNGANIANTITINS